MKEQARKVLADIFSIWCDAIECEDESLIKIEYNRFMGAVTLYEGMFDEYVYHRAQARILRYENEDGEEV